MPATYAPSPRQISYIAALRVERGLEPMSAEAAAALTGGRNGSASAEISRLMAMPREARSAVNPSVPSGAEQVQTPNPAFRAGRMLAAGGIDATVTLADGRHVTVLISTRVPSGRGWRNGAPGENGARTNIKVLGQRVGWINVDALGYWSLTLRSRRPDIRTAVLAIFEYAAHGETASAQETVQEASRCGRCRRTLTDPVSIARGIGPECYGRSTGSQHVPAPNMDAAGERPVLPQPAAPAPDVERYAAISHERAASLTEMAADFGRVSVPEDARAERRRQDAETARATIEAALKAATEDELTTQVEAQRALAIFDRLARA